MCAPFFLLKYVCGDTWPTLQRYLSSLGRGLSPVTAIQEIPLAGQLACIWSWGGPAYPGAPLSSLGTDLALSLLCEWSLVSSSAWMSCAVLVSSLPRCSGQSVWTSVPGDTRQMPLARHSLKYVFALKLEMERLLTISVPKLCLNFLVKPNNFIYPSLIPKSAINIVSSQWMVVAFFTYLSFTRLQNLVRQR